MVGQNLIDTLSPEDLNGLVHSCCAALASAVGRSGMGFMIGLNGTQEDPEYFVIALRVAEIDTSVTLLARALYEVQRLNPERIAPIKKRDLSEHLKSGLAAEQENGKQH